MLGAVSATVPATLAWSRRRALVVARCAAVSAAVVILGAVHLRHRPATLCPLRALTGVPCPFCGGTTAVADLGRGRWLAALRASPLSLGLLLALPFADGPWRPRWWPCNRALRVILVTAALVAAEAWQLHRFGLLSA
jgi:hypothetical protein